MKNHRKGPATEIDVELFEPANGHLLGSPPKSLHIIKTVRNERLIAECWDDSGKLARKTFGPLNIDADPPTVEGRVMPPISGTDATGTPWYNGNVHYYWHCFDWESGLSEASAEDICGQRNPVPVIYGEGRNLKAESQPVFDQVGNETVGMLTVNIDKTGPTVIASISPQHPNGNGWYKKNVTVNFGGNDALSGIDGCDENIVLSTDGAGQFVDGGCLDYAGNASEIMTVANINIDKTPPVITASQTPTANAKGWNNSDVVVVFNCADATSGVAVDAQDDTLVGEGTNQSAESGECVDFADNATPSIIIAGINIDKTPPVITYDRTPANANGWNKTDVAVDFTCTDALSGVAVNVQDANLSSEGADQNAASGNCTDKADNMTQSVLVAGINIDKTPPVVAVTGVVDGTTYTLGSVPAADCGTTDPLSGVASEAVATVSGGTSNNVGVYNVTCSGAVDKAGNSADEVIASYTVEYNFDGFFSPAKREVNQATAGQTIAIKFSLSGNFGLDVLDTTASTQVDCTTGGEIGGAEPTNGEGPDPFKYVAKRYQYQWATEEEWSNTCRVFTLTLDDGSEHTTIIDFNET